jgi:hypothetical protein
MRILIDECLPRKLKHELPEHDVSTVAEMGWAGVKNGELLRLMEAQFDVFITVDGNLTYQQKLSSLKIAIITLKARNNKYETLKPLMARVQENLAVLKPGEILRISS